MCRTSSGIGMRNLEAAGQAPCLLLMQDAAHKVCAHHHAQFSPPRTGTYLAHALAVCSKILIILHVWLEVVLVLQHEVDSRSSQLKVTALTSLLVAQDSVSLRQAPV